MYTQGKRPFGNAWQQRARQNPPGAVIEPVNDAALSTGILCDGLRAIDIDVDDPVKVRAVRGQLRKMLDARNHVIKGARPSTGWCS